MTYWTPERMAEVARLRADGKSWDEIAAIFGKTKNAVEHAYSRFKNPRQYEDRLSLKRVRKPPVSKRVCHCCKTTFITEKTGPIVLCETCIAGDVPTYSPPSMANFG